jgi:ornithine cyclodeaminase/alanine dehydrogenase-like protein (mu-crystallin family)
LFSKKTLVIASQDIETIIHHLGIDRVMDELIERTHQAFLAFDPAQTEIPTRSGFHYTTPHTGLVEWMPLYKKEAEVVIKVVGYHPQNPDVYGLPTILSTISAYDTTSGHLVGLMDGVLPTALRTGAASAVASRAMAHPNSEVLGLIGCGAQSVTQLHALSRLFNLKRVLIYDADPATSASFAARIAPLHLPIQIQVCPIEEIVAEADIICTATSIDVGEGPLFGSVQPQVHAHFNAVGADFPGKIELPKSLLLDSFVCPDFKGQAVVEGECQQLEEENIAINLDQVIKQADDYQHIKMQTTVFDSTGFALEDQIVMDFFLEQALALGIGQEIEIESSPVDAKNPYTFLGVSKAAQQLVLSSRKEFA